VDDLVHNSEKRVAVSGNLMVTTEVNGKSVSTPAVLLAEFPDKLRLELQDPVGGILGLLVVNGDRCWLYLHDKPEIFTGPVDRLPFGLFPHVSGEELVRIFLARPYAEHLRNSGLQADRAVFQKNELSETVLWSDSPAEPKEWRSSRTGQGEFVATYEDYEFKAGARYPTRLKLAVKDAEKNERDLTLAWKDWEGSVPQSDSKGKKLFEIPQQNTFGRKIKALP
jgi:outer membrane lipoprotein-sorting protein